MKTLGWEEFEGRALRGHPLAATIGVFDGLHIGHRELIGRILRRDRDGERLASAVFTFKENPKRSTSPSTYRGELATLAQKLELLSSASVDFCVLIDFSGDFSKLPGRQFLSILRDRGELRLLAVGSDFRCGRGLDTDSSAIRAFCEESSVGVELVDAVQWAGRPVSSSRIREAVLGGRLEEAESMLGRPYEIDMRGAELDAAGAMLARSGQAQPPIGSYEGFLVQSLGSRAVPVTARLDARGRWTTGPAGSGRAIAPKAVAPRALGLKRLVSRV
jgi:FAD synthase